MCHIFSLGSNPSDCQLPKAGLPQPLTQSPEQGQQAEERAWEVMGLKFAGTLPRPLTNFVAGTLPRPLPNFVPTVACSRP